MLTRSIDRSMDKNAAVLYQNGVLDVAMSVKSINRFNSERMTIIQNGVIFTEDYEDKKPSFWSKL